MSLQSNKRHFDFIDGLRFIAAIWVMTSHFGVPPIHFFLELFISEKYALKLQVMFAAIFNGTQAVIVFFIISGFCIHLSYAGNKRQLEVVPFYCARFIRIFLPMMFAVGFSFLIPNGIDSLKNVLWSLYVEMIYYAAYPAILYGIRKIGSMRCFGLTFIVSVVLSLCPDTHNGNFWTYGAFGTAVLGLSVWMLGCVLAEKVSQQSHWPLLKSQPVRRGLRCVMLITAAATMHLHYNTFFHFKFSMVMVAPVCTVWLYSEFLQKNAFVLFRLFSKVGQAAYSMYLVHMLAPFFLTQMGAQDVSIYRVPALFAVAFALTGIFYFTVERPAHKLGSSLRRFMNRGKEKVTAPIAVV